MNVLVFTILLSPVSSLAADSDSTGKVYAGKLNINTASEADFTLLPGIGKITAYRIVRFRDDVDGFKSISQLKRVKGITENLFKILEPNLALFEKSDIRILIDINSASIEALNGLPGISTKESNSIIEFRTRNKGFKNGEELLLAGLSKDKFEEIKDMITVLPYEPLPETP